MRADLSLLLLVIVFISNYGMSLGSCATIAGSAPEVPPSPAPPSLPLLGGRRGGGKKQKKAHRRHDTKTEKHVHFADMRDIAIYVVDKGEGKKGGEEHSQTPSYLLEHDGKNTQFGVLTTEVQIGTETFELVLSTSYRETLVFGTELREEIKRSDEFEHSFYDPKMSGSTYHPYSSKKDARFMDSYYRGDIVVSGEKFKEKIKLGTIEKDGVTAILVNKFENRHHDEMASLGFVDNTWNAQDIDGVMGLGMNPGFSTDSPHLLEGVDLFSLYLSLDGEFGLLEFGRWDEQYFFNYDKLRFAPLLMKPNKKDSDDELKRHFWKVGAEVTLYEKVYKDTTAVIDTGTNNIYGPKDVVVEFLEEVLGLERAEITDTTPQHKGENVKGYYFPCPVRLVLPPLTFKLGDDEEMTYTLYPNEYTQVTATSPFLCEPVIFPHTGGDYWILGGVFLRKYYTVFNAKEKTIGFATADHFGVAPHAPPTPGKDSSDDEHDGDHSRRRRSGLSLSAASNNGTMLVRRRLI